MSHKEVTVGATVTCEYRGAHVGVVLSAEDPRVWHASHAFPGKTLPDAVLVVGHVAWCRSQGLLRDRVPVLWGFGDILWDCLDALHAVPA